MRGEQRITYTFRYSLFCSSWFSIFLAEVEVEGVEVGVVVEEPLAEVIGRDGGCVVEPGFFCEGADAGHEHVFEFAHVGDAFAPEIGLQADDLVAFHFSVEGEDVLPVDVVEPSEAGVEGVGGGVALGEVEVEALDGAEDDLVAAGGGDAGVSHAAPCHDDGIVRELWGAHDFIPADHAAAVFAEYLGAEVGEVVLNLGFAGHAVLLHEGLGGRAGLPLVAWDFISAYVDAGGQGEELAYFAQHVFDELECEVIGGHDVGEHAPAGFDPGSEAGAVLVAQFRVSGYSRAGVAGNFNFRDDDDAEAVGVFDDAADVFPGVEELYGFTVFPVLVKPV